VVSAGINICFLENGLVVRVCGVSCGAFVGMLLVRCGSAVVMKVNVVSTGC